MIDRSFWREWPLAVFTIALQLACAFACFAEVLDWTGRRMVARDLADLIFPVLAIAFGVSLLHLGRPLSAWRSVTNIRESRLSQEICAVGVFGLSAIVYVATWNSGAGTARFIFGPITAVLGIAAVIANARVYRIPAAPRWRTAWAVFSLVALVLAGAIVLPLFAKNVY